MAGIRTPIPTTTHDSAGARLRTANIFRIDGQLGHEIVFLYSGRLSPAPASSGATLVEADGSVVPVAWRPIDDGAEALPLYPAEAAAWLHHL